jgi:hypothetical protein
VPLTGAGDGQAPPCPRRSSRRRRRASNARRAVRRWRSVNGGGRQGVSLTRTAASTSTRMRSSAASRAPCCCQAPSSLAGSTRRRTLSRSLRRPQRHVRVLEGRQPDAQARLHVPGLPATRVQPCALLGLPEHAVGLGHERPEAPRLLQPAVGLVPAPAGGHRVGRAPQRLATRAVSSAMAAPAGRPATGRGAGAGRAGPGSARPPPLGDEWSGPPLERGAVVETMGLEPTTPALQRRCSAS